MTNYPADEPEDHAVPRHAGTLADDRDEPEGQHAAHEDGHTEADDAYATGDAGDVDVNDPDLIVVNETVTTTADTEDDDLDGSSAPAGGAFAVDSAGTTEPTGAEASTETAFGTDAAGEPPADADSAEAAPAGEPVAAEPVAAGASAPDEPAADATDADVAGSAAAGSPQVADPAGSDANELQERWLAIQSDFVNDPHRSVAAAADLVQQAIERMVTDLKQQESALRSNWDGSSADTEALRKALVDYRQFLDRLAAV